MLSPPLASIVSQVRRRWQLRSVAQAISIGGAAFAMFLLLALSLFEAPRSTSIWIAVVSGVAASVWLAIANRTLSAIDAATAIERASGSLDNLVVTAAELGEQPREISAEIRAEIDRQAADRLRGIDVRRVVPVAQPVAIAIAVVAGCVVLGGAGTESIAARIDAAAVDQPETIRDTSFKVVVSPPRYTQRAAEEQIDPVQISVIAGSRVRIDTARGTFREWVAASSEGLEVRTDPNGAPRFLSVIVVPDAPPSLRVVTPGKDRAFATPVGQVPIQVDSSDDLGLATMALRFTKASGGGENLAFTEGEVPLAIERRSGRQWIGRADLSLATLGLADGDILVYRAIARDTNPNGTAVQSEQYLIEIGKTAQISDAGFSLPTEEKKYAISQQMVIYKTEELLRTKFDIEQTRMIAIEQRMVRAEVVFLGGGEVEDEVEEAAHSHELAEGRLQNTGRAEMMRALNAMSRAEALLNDGRAREALVFEREALASLERALDRRRYFLRTLPDRSRIDMTRRLTGTRADARSWLRNEAATPDRTTITAHRRLMQELVAAASGAAAIDASLAARVTAIDPSHPGLQKAAVAIASASSAEARRDAVRSAMQALTAHALQTLPAAAAIDVPRDPLAGQLATELGRKR